VRAWRIVTYIERRIQTPWFKYILRVHIHAQSVYVYSETVKSDAYLWSFSSLELFNMTNEHRAYFFFVSEEFFSS